MLDYQVALAQEGELLLAPPLAAQVRERDVLSTAKRVLEAARAAGVKVFHVRLAFDPTYGLRTNRLPRFDGYPANAEDEAGQPRGRVRRGAGTARATSRSSTRARSTRSSAPRCATCSPPRASRTWCSGASPPTSSSSPRPGTPRDGGLQVSVVEDMCAAPDPAFHEFAFANMLPLFGTVTTADEVIGSWS